MMALFSVDFVDGLLANQSIEGYQHHFGNLLHKYLRSKFGYSRGASELGNTMGLLCYAREICQIESKRILA